MSLSEEFRIEYRKMIDAFLTGFLLKQKLKERDKIVWSYRDAFDFNYGLVVGKLEGFGIALHAQKYGEPTPDLIDEMREMIEERAEQIRKKLETMTNLEDLSD